MIEKNWVKGKDMEEHAGLWGLSSQRTMDSSSSTPYESAACSPRSSTDKGASGYYSVSAPSYPLTITCDIRSLPATSMGAVVPSSDASFYEEPSSEDFDFSSRFSETDLPWCLAPMVSADELFYNGQIRPLWYSCEDLAHIAPDHGKKVNNEDDDNHFDFRSSADYNFSMFSASHCAPVAMKKAQRHAGYGFNGQSLDEFSRHSHGQVNKDSNKDSGQLQSSKRLAQNWRASSRQGHDEMIAKQAMMMVQVEENRGRRTGGNKEGSIRRSRSLSPLRVFHMDDELPRHSVETSIDEQAAEQGTQTVSIKVRRLTLKELLHSSSRTEHSSNQKQGENLQIKAHPEMETEKYTTGGRGHCFKSSARRASDSKLKGTYHASQHLPSHLASKSPHGLRYASHMEQTRQQTFLPYKQGLLGCLGITSKSYRSVAGIRMFHSKSQGTRRSAGYDSSK